MSSERINILHVIHSFNIGGMERGIVNLLNGSTSRNFNHKICCITKSGKSAQKIKKNNIKIFELRKQQGKNWSFVLRLAQFLKKESPDIVHTRTWGGLDGIIAAKIAKIPIVIHGEHGFVEDDPYGKSIKRRIIRKILSYGVDHYVAVSEDIKQWLMQSVYIKAKSITKIVNGVDTEIFCPFNIEKRLFSSNGINNRIVVGAVGRLNPIKKHDLFLQAFSKLDHSRYNLKLILIGDGPQRYLLESLKNKLPHSERMLLLGECDDVRKHYNAMDIFVLPSKNEGMSNVILEAMASGLPVIATSVGGNPELVTHKKTGMLIQPDSSEAIRDSINFYLEHPDIREVHGTNARLDAVKRFSLPRMVREYEELYKALYYTLIS